MMDAIPIFWSLDTPGGPLLIAVCNHPESNEEHPDIPLTRQCRQHDRTWYWCEDLHEVWCDGGPPEYQWHRGEILPAPEPF